MTKQQTGLAETLDMAAEKAKCDHCAKKILAFKAVSAWIVKDCVKEFSDCSVDYISEHCLSGDAEVSEHAVPFRRGRFTTTFVSTLQHRARANRLR